MKSFLTSIFSLLLFTAFAQETFTVSGTLKDATDGEDLIGANVLIKEIPGTGAATNVYGFYSISLAPGIYTLVIKYVGYLPIEQKVDLTSSDQVVNLELKSQSEELEEFKVSADKDDQNVTANEVGVIKFDPKDIETIPVFFGEPDVLKTVSLLPGVQSAGEGNSGFYVRGGSADQNLVLLDGAPVYNASHLLGFFSVFNSDALKDVNLIKGGMPAEFGGRLSSVMDIKMKEGNSKELSVSGGIGLISSKLTIAAPIKKDKGSFIISGRRTYADVFLKLSNDSSLNQSTLYFYDLNLKANYTLSDKDRIFLSGYFGRDKFGFGDSFGFDWGNATGTTRWNHIYNPKLFSNTSLVFSNYNYKFIIGAAGFSFGSTIRDWNFKQDFQYFANDKHNLKFGLNVIHHTFSPGEVEVEEGAPLQATEVQKRYGLESAVYIQDEFKINPRLNILYGLRYSNYTALGPGEVYTFDNDGNLTETNNYKNFEAYQTYHGIEPRLLINFIINEFSSIKSSYARNYQYLHLLSNSSGSSPTDIWLPSSNNIKPQISDQVTLGYYRNLKKNAYELSAEMYYKRLENVIDYRVGAEINFNDFVEGDLIYGDGQAYGIELLAKKKKGDLTGWVGYTLSRSLRRFDEVDNGNWISARQDRIHDLSIVAMYSFSDRVKASSSWVYYTGDAFTFPSGKYEIEGTIVNQYTERNGYRFPNYHRLDLGVTIYSKKFKTSTDPESGEEVKIKKKVESSWNFSMYNAYGRENAFSINVTQNPDNPNETQVTQLALFRWVPSITYNFKF